MLFGACRQLSLLLPACCLQESIAVFVNKGVPPNPKNVTRFSCGSPGARLAVQPSCTSHNAFSCAGHSSMRRKSRDAAFCTLPLLGYLLGASPVPQCNAISLCYMPSLVNQCKRFHAACNYDLSKCPPELRLYYKDGTLIGCMSISVSVAAAVPGPAFWEEPMGSIGHLLLLCESHVLLHDCCSLELIG